MRAEVSHLACPLDLLTREKVPAPFQRSNKAISICNENSCPERFPAILMCAFQNERLSVCAPFNQLFLRAWPT